MSRWRLMASTAPAPVPTRAIVGPVLTQAGFQYWYLACFPDCVVAVRQGIWDGLMLAMSGTGTPKVPALYAGALGVLVMHLLKGRGQKVRQRAEMTLQSTPTSRLRLKPNVVYQTMQLRSISFKRSKFAVPGSIVTSDVIFETKSGGKQKYGVQPLDFDKSCEQLKQMYPDLCKTL
jgi:hypothetical protein